MVELIYYWSYLVFPFLFFLLTYKKITKSFKIFFLFLSIIFIYSRFIEPQIITVNKTNINLWFNTKIALISDLHIWKYKKEDYLKRVVNKINNLDIDYLFIAWDLTYYPEINEIRELFLPFKNLNKPTYWVLWNHDVEKPGPKIREELIKVLKEYWLISLNNKEIYLWKFKLIWLWSYLNNEDNTELLDKHTLKDNIIVLTHNPDTTSKYNNKNIDLTLCWHTHGWQIRIPYLYKKIIPTIWNFDKWLTIEENTQLFITSWLWETLLPIRLFNFPIIDVIEVY